MSDRPYQMTIDLNVLNHLGINLYSNNPAILSEAVANAWDADAETVNIDIDAGKGTVIIEDDGHGMSADDINAKYLRVGHRRREDSPITSKHQRPVMGRKGIGKLSLFSIADTIVVQSAKDGHAVGFTMSRAEIEREIKRKQGGGTYYPKPLSNDRISVTEGTRIELRDLRKRLTTTEVFLRRRIARRFTVIGASRKFRVFVNKQEVGVGDRHYFSKLQYVWHYGDYGNECASHCTNAEKKEARKADGFEGWIGTVKAVGQLKDDGKPKDDEQPKDDSQSEDDRENLNKVLVMARGKLVQEDILAALEEGGLYTKYLIGEIQCDALDDDDKPDIATTSRQALIEDDPRFALLRENVRRELSYIRDRWTAYRNEGGTNSALESAAIKEWFGELGNDDKSRARRLFGRINQMTADRLEDRATLFKHGVLAFQHMKAKRNLDELDNITAENVVELGRIFSTQDDLEATSYYQIVKGRIKVIQALADKVDDDALEKTIQEHLFEHLWLLDPSWERATGTPYMEKSVISEFNRIDAKLPEEERRGRVDIKYRTSSGKHVIIELKRSSVTTDTSTLLGQVDSYRQALRRVLNETGEQTPNIETVCVVGKPLRDWGNPGGQQESADTLRPKGIRVLTYKELIQNAEKAYQSYIHQSRRVSHLVQILDRIDEEVGASL